MTNYSGQNRRGRITPAPKAHPLVRRFIDAMNDQRTTYAEVAARANIGVDTMRYWRSRHTPRLDLFEAALNVLDLELCIRPRRTEAQR